MKQTHATVLKTSYLSIIVGLHVAALTLQGTNWKEGFYRSCANLSQIDGGSPASPETYATRKSWVQINHK